MSNVTNRLGKGIEVRPASAAGMQFIAIAWEGDHETQTLHELPDALQVADALRLAPVGPGFDRLVPAMQDTVRIWSAELEGQLTVTVERSERPDDLTDISPDQARALADRIEQAAFPAT